MSKLNQMSLQEIWNEIEHKAKAYPELIDGISAIFNVHLTGDEANEYSVIFKEGSVNVQEGEHADGDCSLIISLDNFRKLLQGKLNTTTAFMTGKVKVKGNIGLALKLENTLKKFSF